MPSQVPVLNIKRNIEKEFGIKLSHFEKIDKGYSNDVFGAYLKNKSVIVRMSKKKNTYPMEFFVYKKLSEMGLPVPDIYYYKEKPTQLDFPTMIMQKIPGIALRQVSLNKDVEKTLYEKAGKLLRKIHEFKINGFGDIILKKKELKGKYKTIKDFWQARRAGQKIDLKYLLTQDLIDQYVYKLVSKCFNDICNIQLSEGVFVHGDFHQDHIFTDLKRITGFIDISNGFSGDPRYDIAYTLFFLTTAQEKPFLNGYHYSYPDEVVLQYLIFISGEKLSWRYQKGNVKGAKEAKKVLLKSIRLYDGL